jgi:hypothetical protein
VLEFWYNNKRDKNKKMSLKTITKSFKKFIHKKGATLILGLGLSALLIVFAVGVGMVVRNTTTNIKTFKNQWQAQLMAESVKEKMLFMASTGEAGFSMENDGDDGCKATIIDTIYDVYSSSADYSDSGNGIPPAGSGDSPSGFPKNPPGGAWPKFPKGQGGADKPPPEDEGSSSESSLLGNNKCSIAGKGDEPVFKSDETWWFTVPKANTGDAGVGCSPLRKFTSVPNLINYYNNNTFAGSANENPSALFFSNNPLNHPCNWGKLRFGSNTNSRVVVPLYHAAKRSIDPSGAIDPEGPLDQFDLDKNGVINPNEQRAVGTNKDGPSVVKPLETLQIRIRPPCKPINLRPDCLLENAAGNKTNQIDTDNLRCIYEDVCIEDDRYELSPDYQFKTIALWQISGECTGETLGPGGEIKDFTETCAMIPSDAKFNGAPSDGVNSEIYGKLFDNDNKTAEIKQDASGKIAYYKHIEDDFRSILNFITIQDDIPIDELDNSKYTFINKPILQLSIIVDALKDVNEKNIPYLEYQIVTNVPISNISQQFKTEINYEGQSFLQNYSIDQKKNVVDFALQD